MISNVKTPADRQSEALRRYADQAATMAAHGLARAVALPPDIVVTFEHRRDVADRRRAEMAAKLARVDAGLYATPPEPMRQSSASAPPARLKLSARAAFEAGHGAVMAIVNRELAKRQSPKFRGAVRMCLRGSLF